jgi:hypothetical protein
VAVTNNSNKPLIKYEGIEISPGLSSNIGITRTFYSQLSSPYGNCRNDVETPSDNDSAYYKYTVLMGDKYTRNQCYEICFQYKHAIAKCKCADPSVNSNVNNATVCGQTDKECILNERSAFTSSNCDTECPEVCERVEYSYKVSTSSFPTM